MLRKLGIGLLILWGLIATLPDLWDGLFFIDPFIYVFILKDLTFPGM